MAIHADFVFEVRSDGDDTNGGGYKSSAGTTDYSQQASAQASFTNLSSSGTALTDDDAGGLFTAAMVGNAINIGGKIYEITARTDGNNVTLDRAPTGDPISAASGKVGGAFASPGMLTDVPWVDGNKAWIKGGTDYTLTTATAGPAGPLDLHVNAGNTTQVLIDCYTATRGDGGTAVMNAGAVTTMNMVNLSGDFDSANNSVLGLIADGNNSASVNGFTRAGSSEYSGPVTMHCEARNCVNGFTDMLNVWYCKAYDNSGFGISSRGGLNYCSSYDNGGDGFVFSGGASTSVAAKAVHCLAYDNGGDGFDLSTSENHAECVNCTSVGNTGDGFAASDFDTHRFINCIAAYNLTYGYHMASATGHPFINCAAIGNSSGNFSNSSRVSRNEITLTADPFVARTSGDFRLNNIPGGGALLRGIATLPGQRAGSDIGAVQHSEPVISSAGIVTVPSFVFPSRPLHIATTARASTGININALNGKIAMVFEWPHDDTEIDKVYWKGGSASGDGTVTGSIFTVDATDGEPDAVISGATADQVWTSTDDHKVWEFDLGTNPTLTRGTLYALHVECTAYTSGSLSFMQTDGVWYHGGSNEPPLRPSTLFDPSATGTWTEDTSDHFVVGVVAADGSSPEIYIFPPGADGSAESGNLGDSLGDETITTASTHDEIGNTFQLPVPMRSCGWYYTGDFAGDVKFILYGDPYGTPTILGSHTIDYSAGASTTYGQQEGPWDEGDVLLDAGTDYAIAMLALDASGGVVIAIDTHLVAMKQQLGFTTDWKQCERDTADAGNRPFSNDTPNQVVISLLPLMNGISRGDRARIAQHDYANAGVISQ